MNIDMISSITYFSLLIFFLLITAIMTVIVAYRKRHNSSRRENIVNPTDIITGYDHILPSYMDVLKNPHLYPLVISTENRNYEVIEQSPPSYNTATTECILIGQPFTSI